MTYLIDTNVISEAVKKNPQPKVLAWLSSVDIGKCHLSVLTLGEIRKGIEKLESSPKKQTIIQWLEDDLLHQFMGRVITVTPQIADKWGYISSLSDVPAIDGLIAASALVHNLKLVTRHVKDFKGITGLEVVNPWD